MQSGDEMPAENISHDRKRRRISHACDACRMRKVRCDGQQPCDTCALAHEACTYGTDSTPKNKSDLILNATLRSEKLLREMNSTIASVTDLVQLQLMNERSAVSQRTCSAPATDHSHQYSGCSPISPVDGINNAALSPLHHSTTENILNWPCFDAFPSLRFEKNVSVFNMENSRTPILENTTVMYPYACEDEIGSIVRAFQQNVNFWYPTMSKSKINELETKIKKGNLDQSTHSCLALLMMALGCASRSLVSTFMNDDVDSEESEYQRRQRLMGQVYFDGAIKKMHMVFMDVSIEAAQCLLFTADYLAELSALPQTGISEMESSVAFPGQYHTHSSLVDEEQSSLYFLACISMRRLLNRVHQLLYAKDTGASLDDARFPTIVNELDHQLEEWRNFLPDSFQFSIDTQPTNNQLGAFLRQRYLTCRSVIYRPYLTWALMNCEHETLDPIFLDKCKVCLDVCLLHILNLRSATHTVMVDTWICSLSMAGAMLILLAACHSPPIQQCIGPEITLLGSHLTRLLRRWMYIPGQPVSPSIEKSIKLIEQIDKLIMKKYNIDDTSGSTPSSSSVDATCYNPQPFPTGDCGFYSSGD